MIVKLSERAEISEIVRTINQLIESNIWISPILNSRLGKGELPDEYKRDGLLAYADGTDWNPGNRGKGLYRYDSITSDWIKVG